MRYIGWFILMGCMLLSQAPLQSVSASGILLEVAPDPACSDIRPKTVTYSANRYTYKFEGTCNLVHTRARLPIQIPFTVVSTYEPSTGKTTDDIDVPAPAINQPSRPYGHFYSTMRCNIDPWLYLKPTNQPPYTNIQCDQIVHMANPPASAWPPGPAGNYLRSLIDQINSFRIPYSSVISDEARAFLLAQVQALMAAEKRSDQLLQGSRQPSGALGAYTALIHPSVVTPTSGQIVYSQSAVSIKLAPPQGWTVTGYTINIQRRDPNGTWVNHTTIPIAAATAHSPAGYTGFGGGAPPAFLMLPGKWRLNAQASSPKMSGVSDWVEFNAIFTSDATTLKKKRLY